MARDLPVGGAGGDEGAGVSSGRPVPRITRSRFAASCLIVSRSSAADVFMAEGSAGTGMDLPPAARRIIVPVQ
jgi:hypothetical protein